MWQSISGLKKTPKTSLKRNVEFEFKALKIPKITLICVSPNLVNLSAKIMFLHGLRIYKIKKYIYEKKFEVRLFFLAHEKLKFFQRIVTKYQILYFCISVLVSDLSCWSSKTGMKMDAWEYQYDKRTSS